MSALGPIMAQIPVKMYPMGSLRHERVLPVRRNRSRITFIAAKISRS